MALSNWDTLAVDHKGESVGGSWTSPAGVTVEFYKNWLYVRHPKAWTKASSFIKPVIMQINSGDFTYLDVNIHAVRGPKNGVYAAIWTSKYQEQSKEKGAPYVPPTVTGMVGIGCYGFKNEVDLVLAEKGRKPEPGDFWNSHQSNKSGEWRHFLENWREVNGALTKVESIEYKGYDLDDLWVGVEKAEIEFLQKFLKDEDNGIPEELGNIDLTKATRFNQGDAFFAEKLGAPLPGTLPGESQGTVMGQMGTKGHPRGFESRGD